MNSICYCFGYGQETANRIFRSDLSCDVPGESPQACRIVGLEITENSRLRKNDPRKEAVAWLLRKKTPTGLEWISARLEMGSRANVSRAVCRTEEMEEGSLMSWKTEFQKMYGCAH